MITVFLALGGAVVYLGGAFIVFALYVADPRASELKAIAWALSWPISVPLGIVYGLARSVHSRLSRR